MHAVVSLFGEHTTEAVKNLWTELATDFGIRQLAEALPYPHFTNRPPTSPPGGAS